MTVPVSAIVAAYNEADRIGPVLQTLTTYPGFVEVIVVDDGSTDGTAERAEQFPVTCLRVAPNQGKGHALDVGVAKAAGKVLFFADADIVGLSHDMIAATLEPVVAGDCEMFVLMRNRRIYLLRTIMAFIPLLGGERALTRRLWESLPDRYKAGYRIEAGLNFYAVHHGAGLRYRVFRGIRQTVKESKFGLVNGMRRRLGMFAEVLAAAWDLQTHDLPTLAAFRRRAAAQLALAVVGLLAGLLIVAAGIAGPARFFASLFADELREDPGAPLVTLVLKIVSGLGTGAVLAIGGTVFSLNLAFFVHGLARLLTAGRPRSPG